MSPTARGNDAGSRLAPLICFEAVSGIPDKNKIFRKFSTPLTLLNCLLLTDATCLKDS